MPANAIKATSPCKLNLFLELLHRREDGFHEIDTVMVAIDLRDEITIRRRNDQAIRLSVDWLPDRTTIASELGVTPDSDVLQIPTDQSNLACRAIDAMTRRFSLSCGFDIELLKRVPAGAGLGGASANAAITILAINQLLNLQIGAEELRSIGAELGSDIPFFMGDSVGDPIKAARCTGRGEIIEPLPVGRDLHFLVVYPNATLSTARVYSRASVSSSPMCPDPLISRIKSGTISETGDEFGNRLSGPACEIEPRIEEIHRTLWQCGLKAVQLTGSGSASFALMPTRSDADAAAIQLRKQLKPGALVYSTSTIDTPTAMSLID